MAKDNLPFTLSHYTIVNGTATKQQVDAALRRMCNWMYYNQEEYTANGGYQALVQAIQDNPNEDSLPLTVYARSLGLLPPREAEHQPYNMAEMFRSNILTKTALYIQNEQLTEIIQSQEDPTVKSILDQFKKDYRGWKTPTWQYTKQTLARVTEKGLLHSTPSPDGLLPLWATDTHYAKLSSSPGDRAFYLTLKLEDVGIVTLRFMLPKNERFILGEGDKISRPNIRIHREKNKVVFSFTVQRRLPELRISGAFTGADLGEVETHVSTTLFSDGSYSPPMYVDKHVRVVNEKIDALWKHCDEVSAKADLCERRGHMAKAEVLREERRRVRAKISRLKVERAYRLAHQLVGIAVAHGSTIVLEDLRFAKSSSWDRARQQEAVAHQARRVGVPVRHVNAAYTSQRCAHCNGELVERGRAVYCGACKSLLNRDVSASRQIVRRGARAPLFSSLVQSNSVPRTRASKPVTPGQESEQVGSLSALECKKSNLIS